MRHVLLALALVAGACGPVPAEWEPDAKRIAWHPAPLTIAVDDSLAGWRRPIEAAAREVNARAGCLVLVLAESDDSARAAYEADADIIVSRGAASSDADGIAYAAGRHRALVYLVPSSLVGVYLVALHEIGHSLGLAHDLRSSSVMRPDISDHDEDPLPLPTLSDRDAAGLRTTYCPRGRR